MTYIRGMGHWALSGNQGAQKRSGATEKLNIYSHEVLILLLICRN